MVAAKRAPGGRSFDAAAGAGAATGGSSPSAPVAVDAGAELELPEDFEGAALGIEEISIPRLDEAHRLAGEGGALPPRQTLAPPAGQRVDFAKHVTAPEIAYHRGEQGQAAAMTAWPTGGGLANPRDARGLEVLAAIFNDRLFDRLRAELPPVEPVALAVEVVRVVVAVEAAQHLVAAAPHRDRNSLRRGVFHNSKQLDDGSWTWRYDSFRKGEGFEGLWDDVPNLTTPTTLVRGAKSFFVNDEDAAEFARSAPGFQTVHIVADSGHSVQGDQPRALVEILRGVLTG